jgi:hypothetical protein
MPRKEPSAESQPGDLGEAVHQAGGFHKPALDPIVIIYEALKTGLMIPMLESAGKIYCKC